MILTIRFTLIVFKAFLPSSNPTNGFVTISFESIKNSDFRISMLNVLSEVVFEEELIQFSGIYKKQLNLEDYAKSVYLIRIRTATGIINKKLILR